MELSCEAETKNGDQCLNVAKFEVENPYKIVSFYLENNNSFNISVNELKSKLKIDEEYFIYVNKYDNNITYKIKMQIIKNIIDNSFSKVFLNLKNGEYEAVFLKNLNTNCKNYCNVHYYKWIYDYFMTGGFYFTIYTKYDIISVNNIDNQLFLQLISTKTPSQELFFIKALQTEKYKFGKQKVTKDEFVYFIRYYYDLKFLKSIFNNTTLEKIVFFDEKEASSIVCPEGYEVVQDGSRQICLPIEKVKKPENNEKKIDDTINNEEKNDKNTNNIINSNNELEENEKKLKKLQDELNELLKKVKTIKIEDENELPKRLRSKTKVSYEDNKIKVRNVDELFNTKNSYMKLNNCLLGLELKVYDLNKQKFVSEEKEFNIAKWNSVINFKKSLTKHKSFFEIFDSITDNMLENVATTGIQDSVQRNAFIAFFVNYLLDKDICKNILHNNLTIYFENDIHSKVKFYVFEGNVENNITNCKERFYILNVSLHFKDPTAHANMAIIDTKKKEIIYFEPHGVDYISNKILQHIFSGIGLRNYSIFQTSSCPNSKLQNNDTYCASWSLYYCFMKLLNPDMLDALLLKKLRNNRNIARDIKCLTYITKNSFPNGYKNDKYEYLVFNGDQCYKSKYETTEHQMKRMIRYHNDKSTNLFERVDNLNKEFAKLEEKKMQYKQKYGSDHYLY